MLFENVMPRQLGRTNVKPTDPKVSGNFCLIILSPKQSWMVTDNKNSIFSVPHKKCDT